MATPAVTPQATAWDEQGNPTQPQQPAATSASAWDEQGNPVTSQKSAPQSIADPDEIPETSYGEATWGAIKNLGKDTLGAIKGAVGALNPKPQDDEETGAMSAGGIGGMLMYRMTKALGSTVMQAHDIPAAIHDINQSPDPIGTYAKILQKTASQGAGQAITAIATEGAAKGVSAAAKGVMSDEPGIVSQITKGKNVAEPQANEALGEAAQSAGTGSAPASLREGLTQPINAGESAAQSLYKQIDDASGTDFKALNQKLKNTNKQIRLLTDTPEDQAMEAKLEQSRTGLQDKIDSAKREAIAKGVDPKTLKQADAAFKQTEALRDVEEKVFKNVNVVKGNAAMGTEETVNIDAAVKELQKLQDNEAFGSPRLEQAFGKDGAKQLLSKFYDAQRQGVHAMKVQQVAKWVARIAGGAIAYEGAKAVLSKSDQP
jgi:hypothetical protein